MKEKCGGGYGKFTHKSGEEKIFVWSSTERERGWKWKGKRKKMRENVVKAAFFVNLWIELQT